MEGISTFLESSTIHGLTYISTTRRFARLFWILVVTTGILGASWLIKESFESWSESPVKTTIETLPISEIGFPKVTVCPPKNTFTDLNYDLMMTENITLTEAMRDEIFEYAVEVLNENSFSESDWTKLHEENRFYNWYHGYSNILAPYYDLEGRVYISLYVHLGHLVGSCQINPTQHEHDFSLVYISEVDKHKLEVMLISIIKHQLNFKFILSSGEVFNLLST